MTAFDFELVTPERVLWSGAVEAVSMRDDIGELTILANHASLVGALDITVLRITPSAGGDEGAAGEEIRAAVHGGFLHVDENKAEVAAPVAELASEVDVPRARRALDEAGAAAAEDPQVAEGVRGAFLDPESPEARRRRATARLEAAGAADAA